jgi:hypothetical protein
MAHLSINEADLKQIEAPPEANEAKERKGKEMKVKETIGSKALKIGSKKPKISNLSRTTQLEIKVKALAESVKALVDKLNTWQVSTNGTIISIKESPEEKKERAEKEQGTIRYGD